MARQRLSHNPLVALEAIDPLIGTGGDFVKWR
jgi:hypothetical protein